MKKTILISILTVGLSAVSKAQYEAQYFEDVNNDGYLDYVDDGNADGTNYNYWEGGSDEYSYEFNSRVNFTYRVQESFNGSSWWGLSGLFSGNNNSLLECIFGGSTPVYTRLVEYGKASTLLGLPSSVSIFGGLGLEKLQKVTEAIKDLTGGIIEIELKLPTSPSVTGGGIGIAWPSGASPTAANVTVLGAKVGGITSGGQFVVNVPTSLLPGAPSDYEFGVVITEDPPIKVEFLDSSGNVVTDLKIGKWVQSATTTAFNGPTSTTIKTNYVDLLTDRFKVRVSDVSQKGEEKVNVSLTTTNGGAGYDESARLLQLTETSADSGVFESEALLLMSDSKDDSQNKARERSTWVDGNGALQSNMIRNDNTDYDRTHISKLGGTVSVVYPETGTTVAQGSADVLAIKKVIVKIVRFNGVGISSNTIDARWKLVQERFAQVGVRVDYTILSPVNRGSGISFSNNIAALTTSSVNVQGQGELDPEIKLVVDHHRPNKTSAEVYVYYVENLKQTSASGSGFVSGFAATKYHLKSSEDDYGNNIFIDGTRDILYTASHELAHILRDNIFHFSAIQLLLFANASNSTNVDKTKRLADGSHSDIHANPTGLLLNP